jgi:radical SAM-linked protein
MPSAQPDRELVPAVARLRVRYAKRGRMRFASHRDFQRAFERALRRAGVPMAYSAGFSPHPKVSYAGAAATGAASEAEYLELGVVEFLDPQAVAKALDAALPPGLDVLEVVTATVPPPGSAAGSLAERLTASVWRIELRGVATAQVEPAVAAFLRCEQVDVQRQTKSGIRTFDARGAVFALTTGPGSGPATGPLDSACAILHLVVRHQIPAVRPDDVLSALRQVADLVPPEPPLVTRLAQGMLDETTGSVTDPLDADRMPPGPVGD